MPALASAQAASSPSLITKLVSAESVDQKGIEQYRDLLDSKDDKVASPASSGCDSTYFPQLTTGKLAKMLSQLSIPGRAT